MPAVAIAFRENTKPFDKADGVFNYINPRN